MVGFVETEPPARGFFENICERLRIDGQHFFGVVKLAKSSIEDLLNVGEKFLVFGKSLVEQSDNLALEIGSHIDDEKTLATKFTKGKNIFGCDFSFAVSSETNDLGDN